MKGIVPRKARSEEAGALSPFAAFPFSLGRMRDEFDRLFERLAREMPVPAEFRGEEGRWGLEVEELDDKVVVRAEAPGFEPGDFDLGVEDGRLTLRAAKKVETKGEKGETRMTREWHEAVSLPAGIDKEKIEAAYRNGVLTVTLPKLPAAKPRRIAVKPG